jgi:hypothetical protein
VLKEVAMPNAEADAAASTAACEADGVRAVDALHGDPREEG